MSAVRYRETVWSELYAGSRLSVQCLQPAVLGTEIVLALAPQQQRRTIWRIDGGFGSDDQLQWLLARHYHFIAKGFSGRRANVLARQVQRWNAYGDVWLGRVPCPLPAAREIDTWVLRRWKKDKWVHSYYMTTLRFPSLARAMAYYNQRGGAEVEQFRNDKQGLHLSARRKRHFVAQKTLITLTDMAHNLLADFYHTTLRDSRFAAFGPKRIVRDLLVMEGYLTFDHAGHLQRITLNRQHPYAEQLLQCLLTYCVHVQLPVRELG